MTYAEMLSALLERRRFGVRPGFDRIARALAQLGNPERELPAIHITGTNGKGSTAAMTESILRHAGYKTGLFTSPHLLRFTERVRIGGVELSREEAAEFGAASLRGAPDATYFEVATALAFAAFHAHAVEVAVVEAGLGGRLDSTNVFERPLVTVVTSVAYDHEEVLGHTLEDIAREKAGIFKPGVPAVVSVRDSHAESVLLARAQAIGCPIERLGREFAVERTSERLSYRGPGGPLDGAVLGLLGAHQVENAALALAAVGRSGLAVSDEARQAGLARVEWSGRLEWLAPDLVVDGAHNPDGARALACALPELSSGRPVVLLFGVVADKDRAAMLAALRPQVAEIVFTMPGSPRALPAESLLPLWPGARAQPDVAEALDMARRSAREVGGLVVACGSLFLVAEIRRLLGGEESDPIATADPPATWKPAAAQ